MMKIRQYTLVFPAVIAIVLAAGCIPSLYPIYTDQDIVVRDVILGQWTDAQRSQTWEFSKGDGGAYELVYTDKDGLKGRFDVHLTEIGEVLFMDLFPSDTDASKPGFVRLHVVSTHTFFRVRLDEETLSLSFLNPQWLKQNRDKLVAELPHVRRGDHSVVLTADTGQLRRFVEKYLEIEAAFTTPFPLRKVSN